MNIIVNSDRTVEKEYTEKDGSQNENRVTELNFTLPEEYSGEGFVPKIAFITEDGNFSDYIDNGKYILKNNITKYREVICFVWLTNSVNNIDFRSQTFPLEFYYNEDPSDYIPSEQEKSQIELLMEELEEKIQEVTELEENVYTKDETYSKEEVDEIIPTDISDLNNDSGFIDKDVNNLTNYYKKSETYTKQEIDGKISSVYKYKGTVASYNNLPSTDLTIGDVYNVEDTGDNYAWTGTAWDKLGGDIDLSGYYTKNETDTLLGAKQNTINSSHKLDADLVDDTNSTHKFTNSTEKNTWNAKYNKPSGGIPKTDLSEKVKEDLEKADEALDQIETIEEDLYGEIDAEVESNSATLTGTKEGRDLSIKKIYGNSTQESTTGANLQKFSSRENPSYNYKCDEKGQVIINGTVTSVVTLGYNLSTNPMTLTAGTYKMKVIGNMSSNTLILNNQGSTISLDSNKEAIITLNADTSNYYIQIYLNTGTHNDNFYITLASGLTATTERYTGGTVSPNPTYKQDINNVEGDVIVKGSNKNLFDINNLSGNNIDITNGVVTATAYNFYNLFGKNGGFITNTDNYKGQISVSLSAYNYSQTTTTGSGMIVYIRYTDNTTEDIIFPNNTSSFIKKTLTSNASKNVKNIGFSYSTGADEVWKIKEFQVEYNNASTDYVEHKENTATFPLSQGQKLMLGDYLADDGIHHVRGRYVFTGNETLSSNIANQKAVFYGSFLNDKDQSTAVQSNSYKSSTSGWTTIDNNFITIQNNSTFIFIRDDAHLKEDQFVSLRSFKTYLAEQYANGTPVTLEYDLAEETIEPYTPAQQTAYDNLQKMKQYDDITYLSVSSTEVVSQFDISYDGDRIEVLLNDVSNLKIGKEDKSNKKSELNNNLTNDDYLGAKVVYDALQEKQTQIDNLKAENDQLWNDHPDILDNNAFPSGTDLTLNGTGDLKMKVDVGGNSTQVQYRGKNKLSNLAAVYNTTVNNGVVTQSQADTRTDLIWKCLAYNGNTLVQQLFLDTKNTTGLFSRNFTKDSSFNKIRFGLSGSETDSMVVTEIDNLPDGEYTLSFDVTNTTQGSISWKDIMITSSSETDLSYEPYVGGTTSPNPTYKQDINNVEGNVEVKGSSKNWFPNTIYNTIDSSGNAELQDNGYYKVQFPGNRKIFENQFNANTQYTISFYGYNASDGNGGKFRFNYTDETYTETVIYYSTETKYSLTSTANKTIASIGLTWGGNNISYIKELQLEEGSTATPYVPHAENIVTFPLAQGQKLMLGDTLEDDGIHHKRGQVVFDGTENWSFNLSSKYGMITITNAKPFATSTNELPNVLCNCLTKIKQSDSWGTPTQFISSISNTNQLTIKNSEQATTLEELKSWLAEQYANGTPVIVEYELETETIEAYTTAQQTAYNKLKEMQSYYDLTYVVGSSDNAQPILTAHAKKSLKVMQSEIDELKQAILNS